MAADTEKIKQLCTHIEYLSKVLNNIKNSEQLTVTTSPTSFCLSASKKDEGFEELKNATIQFFKNKLNKLEIQLKIESSK